MTRTIKVGDTVAWADVQSGWLVRTPDGAVCLRRGEAAIYMIGDPCMPTATVEWGDGPEVVVMAMDFPTEPTFATMRQLAERFEVREALQEMALFVDGKRTEFWGFDGSPVAPRQADRDDLAKRLHDAGFRPREHTAEDAACMLAEAKCSRCDRPDHDCRNSIMPDDAELHAFTIGPDTFIAYSAEDAWSLLTEHVGEERGGDDYEDEKAIQLPDDKSLTIRLEEGKPEAETLTVAEWCAREGRGFLCSTEW